jgi:two-component SAPR family response regulator
MSGPDLAKSVRIARPEIRVLFMSGYTEAAIVHNGTLEEGVQVLQKPFTPDGLVRSVSAALLQAGIEVGAELLLVRRIVGFGDDPGGLGMWARIVKYRCSEAGALDAGQSRVNPVRSLSWW